jgi:hypothetical protein
MQKTFGDKFWVDGREGEEEGGEELNMDKVPYPSIVYDNRASKGVFGDEFDQWANCGLVKYMRNLAENPKDDYKLFQDLGGIKSDIRLVVPVFTLRTQRRLALLRFHPV